MLSAPAGLIPGRQAPPCQLRRLVGLLRDGRPGDLAGAGDRGLVGLRRPDLVQQGELLDRLLPKVPAGARPVPRSDMGWQYQHDEWVGRLRAANVVQSMSRKGNCLDNGATEQVFGHLKDEFFRGREWPDFESFKADPDACVVHWNTWTGRRRLRLSRAGSISGWGRAQP